MNPIIYLIIAALVLAVILIMMVIIYHMARNGDFVLINAFGKSYCFDIPFKKESQFAHAPYIRPINEFLLAFIDSEETKVGFTTNGIQPDSVASPLLHSLQGLEYERVRNRLRTMSSLNPIVNLDQDEGVITLIFRQQQVKLRTIFAPKGQSILLEKL